MAVVLVAVVVAVLLVLLVLVLVLAIVAATESATWIPSSKSLTKILSCPWQVRNGSPARRVWF